MDIDYRKETKHLFPHVTRYSFTVINIRLIGTYWEGKLYVSKLRNEQVLIGHTVHVPNTLWWVCQIYGLKKLHILSYGKCDYYLLSCTLYSSIQSIYASPAQQK